MVWLRITDNVLTLCFGLCLEEKGSLSQSPSLTYLLFLLFKNHATGLGKKIGNSYIDKADHDVVNDRDFPLSSASP